MAQTLGNTFTFTGAVFEDSVAVEMGGPWLGVNSLQFNDNPPMQGDIVWDEGYQFLVDIIDNTVSLGARRNYGNPIECQEFFDTMKDCDDIISFLNGAGVSTNPGVFKMYGNDRVALYEDPTNHRIYVGLNFGTTDVCKPGQATPAPIV